MARHRADDRQLPEPILTQITEATLGGNELNVCENIGNITSHYIPIYHRCTHHSLKGSISYAMLTFYVFQYHNSHIIRHPENASSCYEVNMGKLAKITTPKISYEIDWKCYDNEVMQFWSVLWMIQRGHIFSFYKYQQTEGGARLNQHTLRSTCMKLCIMNTRLPVLVLDAFIVEDIWRCLLPLQKMFVQFCNHV